MIYAIETGFGLILGAALAVAVLLSLRPAWRWLRRVGRAVWSLSVRAWPATKELGIMAAWIAVAFAGIAALGPLGRMVDNSQWAQSSQSYQSLMQWTPAHGFPARAAGE